MKKPSEKKKKGDQFHRVRTPFEKKKKIKILNFAFDDFSFSVGRGSSFDIIKLMDSFLTTLPALCIFYVN